MWIELGIINYKILIPLIYPFLSQLRRYIHKNDEKPFFEFFTNYCGYLLSGIVYLIIKLRIKKKKKENDLTNPNDDKNIKETDLELSELDSIDAEENKLFVNSTIRSTKFNSSHCEIKLERNKLKAKIIKKKYLFLLLLTGIYLIPMFLDSYCSSNKDINFKTNSSISLFFCIISYVVFSRIILGQKIYIHQIISLAIIIFCNLLTIILILIEQNNENLGINILLIAIILSIYAIFNTLEKCYFNSYMDSPYYLMFVIGFISLILILIYETITCLVFSKNENFNGIFYQFELNYRDNNLYPLIFIGDIISAFFWVGGIHLTVYFFTPCHFIISESISQVLYAYIYQILDGYNTIIITIIHSLFTVIIFASLIYNEVFIINLCSLNKFTQKYIAQRAALEKDMLFKDETKSDPDENTD